MKQSLFYFTAVIENDNGRLICHSCLARDYSHAVGMFNCRLVGRFALYKDSDFPILNYDIYNGDTLAYENVLRAFFDEHICVPFRMG